MAGPRGYPDWQRIENWDSPILYQEIGQVHGAQWQTGILDVSHYGYLAGFDTLTTGRANVTFTWFADSAGAVVVGQRRFTLDSALQEPAQYRLANIGPFVQLTYFPLTGANPTHTATLLATNRVHALELIPKEITLISLLSQPINPSATVTVHPANYYAGPVRVWVNPPAAGSGFQVKAWDNAGNEQFIDSIALVAGAQSLDTVVPPGAWWVNIVNGAAGAGTFSLAVTPSFTGSL